MAMSHELNSRLTENGLQIQVAALPVRLGSVSDASSTAPNERRIDLLRVATLGIVMARTLVSVNLILFALQHRTSRRGSAKRHQRTGHLLFIYSMNSTIQPCGET